MSWEQELLQTYHERMVALEARQAALEARMASLEQKMDLLIAHTETVVRQAIAEAREST